MVQNDYIILFDENGSPYIAHGWVGDTARKVGTKITSTAQNLKNKAHKYIMKIKTSGGLVRYFYSQDEIEAYQNAQRDTARAQYALKTKQQRLEKQAQKEIAENTSGAVSKVQEKKIAEAKAKDELSAATKKRMQAENELMAVEQFNEALAKNGKYSGFEAKAAHQRYSERKSAYEKAVEEEKAAQKAYAKVTKERLQAARDYEMNLKSETQNAEARKQSSLSPYKKDLEERREAEAAAKEAYDDSLTGRWKQHQKDKAEQKAAREAEAEQARQAKEQASTEKQFAYRREAGFKNGSKALWNGDKKNSAYNDEKLEEKAYEAMEQDGVQDYQGDNPKIRSAKMEILNRRKVYEEHKLDLENLQRLFHQANIHLQKAEEASIAVKNDPTSSREAISYANKEKDAAKEDFREIATDLKKVQDTLSDDMKSYRSAIQIYNTNLHLYGMK